MNAHRGIFLLTTILCLLVHPSLVKSQSLVTVINNRPDLSSFAKAIEQNGIQQKLEENGPFTVFAPSNSFLEKEITGKQFASSKVKNLVLNHIITGYASERNMKIMSKAKTLGGMTLQMKSDQNQITVNGIELITLNIKAQNGILHVINGVLK